MREGTSIKWNRVYRFFIKKRVLIEDSSDYSSPNYSGNSSPPPQRTERKSQVLEAILKKLGPIDKVLYTPFKIEPL
jgi:hypothetical protein